MLCISICDKAGLLSEKCKRYVTNLSHLPSVEDCHEDEDEVMAVMKMIKKTMMLMTMFTTLLQPLQYAI